MAVDQQVSHTRTLTVGETFQRETAVPFIRLSGRWLAEAGFHVGDSIRVSVVKNRLCIATGRNPFAEATEHHSKVPGEMHGFELN